MTKGRATAARFAALQILGDIRRRDAHARDVLRESKRLDALDERDRAFAMRLVMGVVASHGLLDTAINRHLASKSTMEPQVRDALRLSAYELLFLCTAPSAVVSQGVELVKHVRPRAAGLANAVLRRIAQQDVARRNAALDRVHAQATTLADLALVSGYPLWIIDQLRKDRGMAAAVDFCTAGLEPAPVYVAPNLARIGGPETFAALDTSGLTPVNTGLCDAFELKKPAGLAKTGLVQDVQVVPADLSAQRIACMVAPTNGGRLLEVGQGRGTKSLLLQNAARRNGTNLSITGVDVEQFKTEVARNRMQTAGVADNVRCVTFDACKLDDPSAAKVLGTSEPYNVVFVDAPCSGTGTLRRHPEIAWTLTSANVEALYELQLRMLKAAATWVRPGGELFYATCSVLRHEDEDVVDEFLQTPVAANFTLEGAPFLSHPRVGGPDGHFCACFRRAY